jgi:drug/metabolite transporter (DMT)-like permease
MPAAAQSTLFSRFYASPYLLLSLTSLSWAGNVVAGKLAVGAVSPMVVVFLRWLVVFALLAGFARKQILAEWRDVLPFWPMLLLMGMFGFTGFNALFYLAAHHTQAVNIAIIQGAMPIVVMLVAFAVYRTPLRRLEVIGALITIVGVLVTASRGEWARLTGFAFNTGDLFMLIATMLYGTYTVMLKARPKVSALTFLAAAALMAFASSVPLVGYEMITGTAQWPDLKGWLLVGYIALFPSLLSQVFYIRGNELIGPARSSLFVNLVPVLGAGLSALVLGERVTPLDVLALVLVLGGIFIAERARHEVS